MPEDKDFFADIVLKYQDFIFNVVRGIVLLEEEAKDITQDVLLRAYKGIENFKGESELSTWLYRIAYNLSINWIKRKKDREVQLPDDIDAYISEEPYDKAFERQLIIESVNKIIEELPEKYKIIIKLYYFEEKSYDEISKILNIPINTVKTHLLRAKKLVEKNF